MRRFFAGAVASVILSFALAVPANAAPITWGASTNISGDSDVRTSGVLVAAFNRGGPGVVSTIINGTQFQPFALNGAANSVGVGNFTISSSVPVVGVATTTHQSLSPAYTSLLTSALRLNADRDFNLQMDGLTAGKKYQFQAWVNNSNRDNGPNFLFETGISDDQGNFTTLYAGDNGTTRNIPPVPGQFVIGEFTADASFQNVVFGNGEIDGWLNGFQLRELDSAPGGGPSPVPLPLAAWAGLALGSAVFARRSLR